MYDLIKIFIPAIAPILLYLLKSWLDNKALFKKLENIDNTQNEKIETLSAKLEEHTKKEEADNAKITEIYEIIKHQPFYGKLSSSLTLRVYKMTKTVNKELSDLLFAGVQSIKPYFEEILRTDFSGINEDIVFLEIKNRIKNASKGISPHSIDLTKFQLHQLYTNVLQDSEQNIRKFAIDLNETSANKTNGERRKRFEEICIELIDSEIDLTISHYNLLKK